MQHPDDGELYDLREDPFEMRNLRHDPANASLVRALQAELNQQILQALGLDR